MHDRALCFIARELAAVGRGSRVLEIGAYNVNGSAREASPPGVTWVGLDLRPGPGVDIVADACGYDGGGQYDVVVCAETMEHCADHAGIIESAWRALRPGGLLIVTAANPLRQPHNDDGGPLGIGDTWNPVGGSELEALLCDWRDVCVTVVGDDTYAVARRPVPVYRDATSGIA